MRMTFRLAAAALLGLSCPHCGALAPSSTANSTSPESSSTLSASSAHTARSLPVPTPRIDVSDSYHGYSATDPYRWLEDDSPECQAWTDAQNKLTRGILDGIPARSRIQAQVEHLMSVDDIGLPFPRKTPWGTWRYFFWRRNGSQNQPTVFVREGLNGHDQVVVDVNAIATDGSISIDWFYPSDDGRYFAYGLSKDGSEDSTLHVREIVRSGGVRELGDRIPRTRFCSLAWKPDNTGFFYTRHPSRGQVPDGQEGYHRKVFEHRLGHPFEQDAEVFGSDRDMTDSPSVVLSPDGRWLVLVVHQGWAKAEVFLRDLRAASRTFVPVAVGFEATYTPIVTNSAIFLTTNEGAPRGRLVRVDPVRPQREHWKEVIPEGAHTLDDVTLVGGQLIVGYSKDASSILVRYDLDGKLLGEIEFPVLGAAWVSGVPDGAEAFVGFTSFAVCMDVFRVSLRGSRDEAKQTLWQQVESPMRDKKVLVDQFFATSKDGTQIPYFVVRLEGVVLDGTAPAVLTGYGGFGISMQPQFLRGANVFVQAGGVFVQANLRGGNEYGEAWHQAGMLTNKQNVFDDMIAVAEDVVRRKVADRGRLAVVGGSNGGLLVGALVVQRPEMFRAAVAQVPLMDMLRYHRFLIGKLWVPEYGVSEDPKLFPVLRAYSPYHNVKEGTAYPAMLLTAAEADSRVHPFHVRKMAAALQYATASDEPILVRVESKAGHGAGKPVSKRVQELADIYTFLMWKLGML